jgi:hypothetical protein
MRAVSRPWLAVAAIGLSLTLHLSDGFYHQPTLPWLGLALVAAVLGVAGVRWPWGAAADDDPALTRGLLVAGVLVSALALVNKPLARYMADPRPWAHPDFLAAVAVGAMVTVSAKGSTGSAAWRRAAVAVLLAVGVWIGVWVVRQSPNPHIDVIPVHEQALHSLARGESPYAVTFDDIYRANESFYAEGMREGRRVLFGFPYPPLSLLMAWPGHAALGDLRYSEVLALVLAAGLIAALGSEGVLCAGALLLAPRVVFHLEQGWTEPFPIVLLALTVWVALRRPAIAWLPLGLLMGSKQHMVLGLVFAPMLMRDTNRRVVIFMAKAVGVAALVTLPFALLDLDAFVRSAVLLQFREPFRLDSLSFTRELLQWGIPLDKQGALALSLSAGVVGIGLSWWRAPRTPAGFAASLALTLFLLTAFGKKAFLNYYFLVVAFLLVAIAASSRQARDTPRASNAAGSIRPQ